MQVTIDFTQEEANALISEEALAAGIKGYSKIVTALLELQAWYDNITVNHTVMIDDKGSGHYVVIARDGRKIWVKGRYASNTDELGFLCDVKQVNRIVNL